jgi:uncharacterized protein YkwD
MRICHLVLICNVWLLAVANTTLVVARETYSAFATRIVAQAQNAGEVKPDLEAELFRLANQFRRANGLPGLIVDKTEQTAARAHATDMMLNHFMGHVASTGHDLESRVRALHGGTLPASVLAENAASIKKAGPSGVARARELFQLWVNSPPHRHALLTREFIGVATGVVSRNGLLYADQIFSGPKTQSNLQSTAPVLGQGLY